MAAWHYPEMRTEVTVTTTGSFSADVTLGFSLTAGLADHARRAPGGA